MPKKNKTWSIKNKSVYTFVTISIDFAALEWWFGARNGTMYKIIITDHKVHLQDRYNCISEYSTGTFQLAYNDYYERLLTEVIEKEVLGG